MAWVGVILAAVVPWSGFRAHSHWAEIIWFPFSTPPELTATDLVANVLLYVPFGFLYERATARRTGLFLRGGFWALLLSVATELTQVYSHGRFPSVTDVVLNVLGACLGLYIAARRRR